jgi:hypothetical protein
LDDDRQASNAIRASEMCEKWTRRLGLPAEELDWAALAVGGGTDDVAGEAQAWDCLIEVNGVILVLHSMVDQGSREGRWLRGSRHSAAKAFQCSLHGLRVAFPAELAEASILRALDAIASRCAEVFAQAAQGLAETERAGLRTEFCQVIRESLRQEASPRPIAQSLVAEAEALSPGSRYSGPWGPDERLVPEHGHDYPD